MGTRGTRFLIALATAALALLGGPGRAEAAYPNGRIIVTDLLDDDIRALVHLLADPRARPTIRAIVTSTGNAPLKAAIARRIVAGFGLDVPVYAGASTDLAANAVTAFAGNFEREGTPLLTDTEIAAYLARPRARGDAPERIVETLRAARPGERLDVLLLTAPIDLVEAIRRDPALAKRTLGDLFVMGLYKRDPSRGLVTPYNTMAGPDSVVELFGLLDAGYFERVFHVPSDTVQRRAGLPGGYIPLEGEGAELRARLSRAMERHPVQRLILLAAQEYAFNWMTTAAQQFGVGVGTALDHWVPATIQSPAKAAGFYLADTLPAALSNLTEAELAGLAFSLRSVRAPADRAPGQAFAFDELAPGAEGRRAIQDLEEFDGWAELRRHVQLLEQAGRYAPRPEFFAGVLPELATASSSPSPSPSSSPAGAGDGRDGGSVDAPLAFPGSSAAPIATAGALVVVFKNSPDDWFALLRLLASDRGRAALRRGGIVCEGFSTDRVAAAVRAALLDLGQAGIPVAAGYSYAAGETDAIPNFKIERAFDAEAQGTRAFSGLSPAPARGPSARSLLQSAARNARRLGGRVDAIVLGEGIDLVREAARDPRFGAALGDLYVMGGGRPDGGKLVLSRNWLPHTDEVLGELERLAADGKRVFVFSSHCFGGALVAKTDGPIGNGAVAFRELEQAGERSPAIHAIYEHWIHFSRVFGWVTGSDPQAPFRPDAPVPLASISPIGLTIADEWARGELAAGASELEIERQPGLEGSGMLWLKRGGGQGIVPLARRFGSALAALTTPEADAYHLASRDLSVMSPEAQESWSRLRRSIRSAEAGRPRRPAQAGILREAGEGIGPEDDDENAFCAGPLRTRPGHSIL